MSGFAMRMSIAKPHEEAVITRLRENGWTAFAFGQGLVPEECRSVLRDWRNQSGLPCYARWFPDIITTESSSTSLAFVDAKAGGEKYPNYSVEADAVAADEAMIDYLHFPIFYVFHDFRVMTPPDVRRLGRWKPGANTLGSHTDFYIVSKLHGRDFNGVFPVRTLYPSPVSP
jgi:hypothetical protein